MHKNVLFFEKTRKTAAAFGAPLPDPHPSCYSHHLLHVFFSKAFVAINVVIVKKEQK